MAWARAGQYGPQALLDANGDPQPGRAVTVRRDGALATLYTDRDRTGTLGNPVAADARGNLTFHADPGTYTLDDGTSQWTDAIYPDPEDVGGVGGGLPAAHAVTHATGGDDPLAPGNIGAATTAALDAEITARTSGDAGLAGRLDALEPATGIIRAGDAAGGVLSGQYPNPGFADDLATQVELDTGLAATLASANGYTDIRVAGIVDSAPATLDTLNELAAALGDDPNLATTLTGQIAAKADATALAAETDARLALESVAVARTLVDAAGDLLVGTGPDQLGRLPRGAASQVVQVLDNGAVGYGPARSLRGRRYHLRTSGSFAIPPNAWTPGPASTDLTGLPAAADDVLLVNVAVLAAVAGDSTFVRIMFVRQDGSVAVAAPETSATLGIIPLEIPSTPARAAATVNFTVGAADVRADGTVTLQMQFRHNNAATGRDIQGSAALPFVWSVLNFGRVAA